ncbi:MAG: methyltransferase domain-containing protein [Pseudonocardia sp.]|nr:methyltransferase domain-containing protein [Pseudonocardia sp.]
MSTHTTTRNDPTESLIAQLDAVDTLPWATELRAYSYDLLGLTPGARVVDVGCGTGRAVTELRDRSATPVGVDASEQMITLAQQRWPGADFRVGTAERLPFANGQLDAYRADKLYHALPDPAAALGEARRVLAPGGRVVLIGQDWDAFVIDSDDAALTRTIVHARADLLPHPRAARAYRNLLLDGGFTQVAVDVRTAIFTDATVLPVLVALAKAVRDHHGITGEQADTWLAEQSRRARAGRLFFAMPLVVATAQR